MVGAFGEVQVMDWGLAKVLADAAPAAGADGGDGRHSGRDRPVVRTRASDTQAGSVLGTPAYMPPGAGRRGGRQGRRAGRRVRPRRRPVRDPDRPAAVTADETAEAIRLLAVRGQLDDAFARLDGCGADPELVALCKRCLAAGPGRPAGGRRGGGGGGGGAAGGGRGAGRGRRSWTGRRREARAAEQRKRRRLAGWRSPRPGC